MTSANMVTDTIDGATLSDDDDFIEMNDSFIDSVTMIEMIVVMKLLKVVMNKM